MIKRNVRLSSRPDQIRSLLITNYGFDCLFILKVDGRRRIEIENTAPMVTETQTNAPKPTVDKNCNATSVDPVQGKVHVFVLRFLKSG